MDTSACSNKTIWKEQSLLGYDTHQLPQSQTSWIFWEVNFEETNSVNSILVNAYENYLLSRLLLEKNLWFPR